MNDEKFEKIITFSPAWDQSDPDPSKNHGLHGVDLRFVLKGETGATQFLLYTNWHLPHIRERFRFRRDTHDFMCRPFPVDKGYHSYVPLHEGQTKMDKCDILDGCGGCYYNGSGLQAENVFERLVREGHEGVWKDLEELYHELFDEIDNHAIAAAKINPRR